ncbi:MAG TPA: hypothetical protein VGC76_05620 [Pyrinomonadaceae bacterium]|jgi:hypothetical protein
MIKTVSAGCIFLFFILLAIQNAFACSCVKPPSVEEGFEQSAAVFYGTVESVESTDKEMTAVFNVEKSWKGADRDRVTVKTDATSCGIDFKTGEKHYLFLDQDGGIYKTVPCRRYAGAQEEFLKDKPPLALQKALVTVPRTFIGTKLLLAAASITAAVFILAALGIALYVFKSKRRKLN